MSLSFSFLIAHMRMPVKCVGMRIKLANIGRFVTVNKYEIVLEKQM